jgi:selenocysteine-specific elongation factor
MHVVATAGHVDHGKSTLVRALTGMEPDRLAEERRRGLTIDLGFAWTRLPGGDTVAFVDVPGHERFVTTMLAGVGPVPAALFVVAADEGVMPQSREHLDALAALGVRHALLVISRCDLADPDRALAEASELLAGTSLAAAPAVCVSAATGAGMAELRAALTALVNGLPEPDAAADVRLWVDRAFTIRGAGTVVTGTLGAGRIRVDDELELMPSARHVTVRGLQCLGADVDEAGAVSRIAVNLRGLPLDAVSRGHALLTPGAWLATTEVDVRIDGPRPLPAELSVHVGAASVPARVRPLGADTVRLRLRRGLPLRIGDRAVLRDPGRHRIAAGATVLDVRPPALNKRGAAARRAAQLATMDGRPSAAAEVARRGVVRRSELIAMGVPEAGLGSSEWLIDRHHAQAVAEELAAAIDPLSAGLTAEAACRAVGLPDARVLEPLLRLAGVDLVLRDGRVTRPAPELPARLDAAMAALRADLTREPFAAPDAARLAELGLGARELAALVRAGELIRLADGVVLLAGADTEALDVLAGLGPEFTAGAARQALGTTRRVAVPLLEHLARTGRTTRTSEGTHRLA